MYEPDGLGVLFKSHMADTMDNCWLFPFKKVLRDTKISQYTFYVEAVGEPMEVTELIVTLALYKCVGSLTFPVPGGGRIVAQKVAGSEVSVTGQMISQTQWTLANPINLEGGSYWLAVSIQTTSEEEGMGTYFFYGITDNDGNIQYPKFEVTLASPPTLPSTINLTAMSRYTTDWFYASGEWY